jgi:hypothetical protein
VDFKKELSELAALGKRAAALKKPDRELYVQVRELKRPIQFANPIVDFDGVLFVDMPFPQGSEWPHETRHRLGYMAVPGARLLILEGLSPAGHLRQLMPKAPLHGSFWRPDLSWDAKQVLFCFKPHNEKAFHLYEINADGTGLRQLTDGIYDDLDPSTCPTRSTSSSPPPAATPTSAACPRPTHLSSPGRSATGATSTSSRGATSRSTRRR